MLLVNQKQLDITDLQDPRNYWRRGKKLQPAKVNAFYRCMQEAGEAGGKGTKRKHNTMQSHPAKKLRNN